MSEDGKRLYLIRHENGPVKIGVSSKPRERLSDLQAACPYRLDLVWTRSYSDAHQAETVAHSYFIDECIRGEWFDIEIEDFQEALPEINGIAESERGVRSGDIREEWFSAFSELVRVEKRTVSSAAEREDLRKELNLIEREVMDR